MYDLTTLQIMNRLKGETPRLMSHPENVRRVFTSQRSICSVFNEPLNDYLDNDLRHPITDGEWQSQPPEKRTWQKHVLGL